MYHWYGLLINKWRCKKIRLLITTTKDEKLEGNVSKFLEARRGQTFNLLELYNSLIGEISYTLDQGGSSWSWEKANKFFLNFVAHLNFRDALQQMVNAGKIKMTIMKGQRYYSFDGEDFSNFESLKRIDHQMDLATLVSIPRKRGNLKINPGVKVIND